MFESESNRSQPFKVSCSQWRTRFEQIYSFSVWDWIILKAFCFNSKVWEMSFVQCDWAIVFGFYFVRYNRAKIQLVYSFSTRDRIIKLVDYFLFDLTNKFQIIYSFSLRDWKMFRKLIAFRWVLTQEIFFCFCSRLYSSKWRTRNCARGLNTRVGFPSLCEVLCSFNL